MHGLPMSRLGKGENKNLYDAVLAQGIDMMVIR